ncbi:hypothetical protein CAOG_009308 [Capsaspora owczarzaki ATCC 30864]|uniref:Uncharacterized protein n=1 Tax=Capsaspora owczarzaki (strain ATCC 30864) TaxID=595528 RepID=A0A0D2WH51_CAPO3|nr:hypothetical protein CAOG_009308 [Capsaspora owczarzaki ATCC 30864]
MSFESLRLIRDSMWSAEGCAAAPAAMAEASVLEGEVSDAALAGRRVDSPEEAGNDNRLRCDMGTIGPDDPAERCPAAPLTPPAPPILLLVPDEVLLEATTPSVLDIETTSSLSDKGRMSLVARVRLLRLFSRSLSYRRTENIAIGALWRGRTTTRALVTERPLVALVARKLALGST